MLALWVHELVVEQRHQSGLQVRRHELYRVLICDKLYIGVQIVKASRITNELYAGGLTQTERVVSLYLFLRELKAS